MWRRTPQCTKLVASVAASSALRTMKIVVSYLRCCESVQFSAPSLFILFQSPRSCSFASQRVLASQVHFRILLTSSADPPHILYTIRKDVTTLRRTHPLPSKVFVEHRHLVLLKDKRFLPRNDRRSFKVCSIEIGGLSNTYHNRLD